MPRPRPTSIYHFTRVEHLASIVARGLVADSIAQEGLMTVEIGNRGIKANRRARGVPCHPNGVVADYVPFYFAPRSPMMYSIHRGNVPEYSGGCGRIIYLESTLETVVDHGLDLVVTDRNAALAVASYSVDEEEFDDLVDWPLMRKTMWNNTVDEPQRMERRMAEALVHQMVPIECILRVVAPTQSVADEAARTVGTLGIPVDVIPEWYF